MNGDRELVLENPRDVNEILLLQDRDYIKAQCATLQNIYSSLSISDTAMKSEIEEIIQNTKLLDYNIDQLSEALKYGRRV